MPSFLIETAYIPQDLRRISRRGDLHGSYTCEADIPSGHARRITMEKDVIELGVASEETKGIPVVGEPDEFGLQKLEAGLSDD